MRFFNKFMYLKTLLRFFTAAMLVFIGIAGPLFQGRVLAAAPLITSAAYDEATGTLVVNGSNFVANPAGPDIDASSFTFTGYRSEGIMSWFLTDTPDVEITSDTQFSLVLSAYDKLNVNANLNKNGYNAISGFAYSLAYNTGWMPGAAAEGNISGQVALFVSNVPRPAINTVTYNGLTGTFTITGVCNCDDFYDISFFTITGGNNAQFTLSSHGVLYMAADFGSLMFPVHPEEKTYVDSLLNKVGTVSAEGTTYNFSAANGWIPGKANPGDDFSDMLNPITVTNISLPAPNPVINSAAYNYSTGTFTVTGTNFSGRPGNNNDIDISCFAITGQGGSYTLTGSVDADITSATQFSFTVTGVDLEQINARLDINGTQSSGGIIYNLAAADGWLLNANPSADISDMANGITVSGIPPTILSAAYRCDSGVLVVSGMNLPFKSGAGNDIDASKITISGENGQSCTLTNTPDVDITGPTSFTLTLSSTDRSGVNACLNKNGVSSSGGTAYNLAAAIGWAAGMPSCPADPVNNPITVSGYYDGPAPVITSATWDAVHGYMIITGMNFQAVPGSANDIAVGAFTVTGKNGQTFTLSHSGYREITNSTSITLSISMADKLGINEILNNNGTSSLDGTPYNIAVTAGWDIGAAGNCPADLTGNPITVTGVESPAITSAVYYPSSGILVVTGTSMQRILGLTDMEIDASKFTLTGEGSQSYTLTDTPDVKITSSMEFTLILSNTDKNAVNALLNKEGNSSSDGTVYNIGATEGWNIYPYVFVSADLTGNPVTVSGITPPAITSAQYDVNTGVITVTGTNFVSFTGANNDVDISRLSITGNGNHAYHPAYTPDVEITGPASFTITLNTTDKNTVNTYLNKNGASALDGTTYNLAVAHGWMPGAADYGSPDSPNPITVSGIGAPQQITSAAYNAATGVLSVTGVYLTGISGGSNDIDASKFTLTGENNQSYMLTDTHDMDITSATSFSLTLSTTDKNAVNQLLNKNGTSSIDGTVYNLAAAQGWDNGSSDPCPADPAGNSITTSNAVAPSPTITSAVYNGATGVLTVTGKYFGSYEGADNDIYVSRFNITGESGQSWNLKNTSNVDIIDSTTFSLTLHYVDKVNVNRLLNKNGTSSLNGSVYNLEALIYWNHNAPVADLTGNAITVINTAFVNIVSAEYDAAAGILKVKGTNLLGVSGDKNDIDVSQFVFQGEGGWFCSLTSTPDVDITDASSFTVILTAEDRNTLGMCLNRNGLVSASGNTYNLCARGHWLAGADPSINIEDNSGNPIIVSNIPAPAITSVSFDRYSGLLWITGTDLLRLDNEADIEVSMFTFTGQGGESYTLTDSQDANLYSPTKFQIFLSIQDKAELRRILNKVGTSAADNTVFNLSAAQGWARGADPGLNTADAVTPVTVTNSTPVIEVLYKGQPVSENITYEFLEEHVHRSTTLTFTIKNTGNDILTISPEFISDDNTGGFFFVFEGYARYVDPSDSKEMTVFFAPETTGLKKAVFRISSTDIDRPVINISLSGMALEKVTKGTPRSPEVSDLTDLGSKVRSNGEFITSVNATSEDNLVTLHIDNGTFGLDVNGNQLDTIRILPTVVETTAADSAKVVGSPYYFWPEGATFSPGITITIAYDSADLNGASEDNLTLAYYNTATKIWDALACSVDAVNHTITATISHFSYYAILAGETAPPPDDEQVGETQINPEPVPTEEPEVTPAQPVMTTTPENPQTTPTPQVKTSEPVNTTSTVTVTAISTATTPVQPGTAINWAFIGGIAGAIVVIIVIIAAIFRRRY